MNSMCTYRCATCQRAVSYEGPRPVLYPFCTPRCQSVDLGRWLREQYVIDRDLTPDETPAPPPPSEPERQRGD
jgi:uncharacterized protein